MPRRTPLRRSSTRWRRNAVTSILLVIAGLLLIFGLDAGFDVLVVPVLVALAGGVTSAWLLLTKIPS